jgi:hypothetical protein
LRLADQRRGKKNCALGQRGASRGPDEICVYEICMYEICIYEICQSPLPVA